MKPLPHGWTDTYAIRYLLDQNERLIEKVQSLETEIARLDRDKQGRKGPKRPIAQGNARSEATQ